MNCPSLQVNDQELESTGEHGGGGDVDTGSKGKAGQLCAPCSRQVVRAYKRGKVSIGQ